MTIAPAAAHALIALFSTFAQQLNERPHLISVNSDAVRDGGSGKGAAQDTSPTEKTEVEPRPGQTWMSSRAVAKRLGIKTGTLKKWRAHGKGPEGWKRTSETSVMYPVGSVLQFEVVWHGFSPTRDRKSPTTAGVGVAN